ncbi:MAG TPA: PLP-dependent aminotransferase family protein [Candidatus Tectomicrobia bacterium]|nr:PLP-dependent aminotransferase family protein [Candidatus Tectomicrobia bacterium]
MSTPDTFNYDTVYSRKVRVGIPRTPRVVVPYDFAVGHPDASTFPSQALGAATTRMLLREGPELALYPGDMSHEAARQLVRRKLKAHEGIDIPLSRIMITNGSTQGLLMVAEAFINPGETVIIEEFCYPGTLRAFSYGEPRYATVPTDDAGILVTELTRVLDRLGAQGVTPKFIYTIANFQNPTGSVMSLERRRALMQVAEERHLLVIEDDAYGDLIYEGEPVTSLYALSRTDNVVRLGTFSKIVAAGVRLGWVIAPEAVLAKMAVSKIDGGTSAFTSRAVAEYLHDHLDDRMDTLLDVYRGKRDAMLKALEDHLHGVATWSRPRGGLFVWVRLSEGVDTTKLLEAAHSAGVTYLPGMNFSPEGKGSHYLRLSFAYLSPEKIREGIAVLARVLKTAQPLKAPLPV